MTATPIPRTLALTLYGDLDASVIDELPPGRTPIVTRRIADARAAEVWTFLRKQVALGRQAYIVYPLIEGVNEDQPELDFAREPEMATTGSGGRYPGRSSRCGEAGRATRWRSRRCEEGRDKERAAAEDVDPESLPEVRHSHV